MTLMGESVPIPRPMSSVQSKQKSERQEALHECVRRAIRRYLDDMGDHDPEGLYGIVMAQVEKPLIEEVLEWAGGNQCRVALALGISRGTLRKKIKAHGIDG